VNVTLLSHRERLLETFQHTLGKASILPHAKYNKYMDLTLTCLGNVGLVGSASSAFDEELQWSIAITKLCLNVLGKHGPVEMIGAERTANVERSTVTQQPADKLHPLKI